MKFEFGRQTKRIAVALVATAIAGWASSVKAQTSDEVHAKSLLERLTGVKWAMNNPVTQQVAQLLKQGKDLEAAQVATSQPQFLNTTVRQMAAKLSTREETLRLQLNDFSASFIGVTRDQTDARELLYGNFFYQADPTKIPMGVTIPSDLADDIVSSNNHYRAIQTNNLDIGAVLMRVNGQVLMQNNPGDMPEVLVANPDPAGVLTSRTFMEAHAVAGTNRRPVEFTFREFMCVKIENWADAGASDARIGRDIDRFPGGDHTAFQTTCKACHTVMDGFRGAFARLDFTNNIVINPLARNGSTGVQTKLNKNNQTFPSGYVTTDDSWVNNAIRPANQTLFGWRSTTSINTTAGYGVQSFGRAVANSERFSKCMAQHVFNSVCKKTLTNEQKEIISTRLGQSFEKNNYNLKRLFEITAIDATCIDAKGGVQ